MKIPYTSKAKAARMNRNPVQAANLFLALKRFVYETLFGMPCDSSSKKTMPRLSEKIVRSKFFKTHYQQMFGRFASFETPPMGQGLAFADVTEEQDRHKEHCHAIVYTNLRPEVVQVVSSISFLESIMVELMDSMTSHELPAIHMLKHTIFQDALKQKPERYARQTFQTESNVHNDDINRFAHLVASSVNMHRHTKTCFKGSDKEFCRLGYKRPLQEESTITQLKRGLQGEVEMHHPDPKPLETFRSQTNFLREGILPRDNRCVLFVPACREIKVDGKFPDDDTHIDLRLRVKDPNHEDDIHLSDWKQNVVNKINDGVPTYFDKALSQKQVEDVFSLSRETVEKVIDRMPHENQYVAPYNSTAISALRCNQAAVLISSSSSSNTISQYLTKYMTKGDYGNNRSTEAIIEAADYIQNYPTAPVNDETQEMRNLKTFCQRLLNLTAGSKEFMATTIAYANQGGMPFNSSHSFVYVFVYDSIRRLKLLYGEYEGVEEGQEVGYGGATLYQDEYGVSVALTQHELYMHRVDPRYRENAVAAKRLADDDVERHISNVNNGIINNDDAVLEGLKARAEHAGREIDNNCDTYNLREFACKTTLVKFDDNISFDELYLESNDFNIEVDQNASVGRKVFFFSFFFSYVCFFAIFFFLLSFFFQTFAFLLTCLFSYYYDRATQDGCYILTVLYTVVIILD